MNGAVKDDICVGGIRKARKPLTHWDLRTNQRGDVAKAVVDDLEKVACFRSEDRIAHQVIKDNQINFVQAGEQSGEKSSRRDWASWNKRREVRK